MASGRISSESPDRSRGLEGRGGGCGPLRSAGWSCISVQHPLAARAGRDHPRRNISPAPRSGIPRKDGSRTGRRSSRADCRRTVPSTAEVAPATRRGPRSCAEPRSLRWGGSVRAKSASASSRERGSAQSPCRTLKAIRSPGWRRAQGFCGISRPTPAARRARAVRGPCRGSPRGRGLRETDRAAGNGRPTSCCRRCG